MLSNLSETLHSERKLKYKQVAKISLTQTSPKGFFGLQVRWRELDIFRILEIYWEIVLKFLGIFWELFVNFLGGFLGEILWEELLSRNYQGFDVSVKILSQCTRKGGREFRSLEVRGKLIALKRYTQNSFKIHF